MGWSALPSRGDAWLQNKAFLNEMIDAYNERVSVMGFRGGGLDGTGWFRLRPPIKSGDVVNSSSDDYAWDGTCSIFPWKRIQSFIETCFQDSKYNRRAYYENSWVINQSYDEVQCPVLGVSENNWLPVQTLTMWRAAAGLDAGDDHAEEINGVSFRRKDKDGNWSYGYITRGDEIGPWLVEDIRKGLNSLTLLRCWEEWENPGLWWKTDYMELINGHYVWAHAATYADAKAGCFDTSLTEPERYDITVANGRPGYSDTPLAPSAWTSYGNYPDGHFDATMHRERAREAVKNIKIVKHYLGGAYVGLLIPKAVMYTLAQSLGGPEDVYSRQGDEFSDTERRYHRIATANDCYDLPEWTAGTYGKYAVCQKTFGTATFYYYSTEDGNTDTPLNDADNKWQRMFEYMFVNSIMTEPTLDLGTLAWAALPSSTNITVVSNSSLGYSTLPGLGLADYSGAFEYV